MSTGMSRKQIDQALSDLVDHGFLAAWERHSNLRYWRVFHGDEKVGVPETPGQWFSQAEMAAWINGVRTMGAAI